MTTILPSIEIALSETNSQPDDHSPQIPKTSNAPDVSSDMKSGSSFEDSDDDPADTTEPKISDRTGQSNVNASNKISIILKERAKEWSAVVGKDGPLQLLDLPMDILKEIVKEVTHTNDLTALALAHSALHNLAIPHIYSRFDIVWPDAHATTDPRTGVDALTYGLATLCMGDMYIESSQTQSVTCLNCGAENSMACNHGLNFRSGAGQLRIGNQYPQFTRKFSLGNGPTDWVQEYLITKESGKMLGTLVALAIARMINLETFVWDMPTGVLRDVWLALSSLQNKSTPKECRLERVWVRWHDNSETLIPPTTQPVNTSSTNAPQIQAGSSGMSSIGWKISSSSLTNPQAPTQPMAYANSRVEYPTLSVLPSLKSLSVLDIDELDYLDEMSVVIAKSKERLRELRVGISAKAVNKDFAIAWDGPDLQQVDHMARWPGASTIGDRRLGGVLGVLLGRVFDIRKKSQHKPLERMGSTSVASSTPIPETHMVQPPSSTIQNADMLLNHIPESLESGTGNEDLANKEDTILSQAVLSTSEFSVHEENNNPAVDDGSNLRSSPQPVTVGVEYGQSDVDSLTALISAHQIDTNTDELNSTVPQLDISTHVPLRRPQTQMTKHARTTEVCPSERERLDGKLRLQTLELERVPLSVAVLQRAFDWAVLTNLTILDCDQHDRLWIMLRKQFQPSSLGPAHTASKNPSNGSLQYHLNLKKVHTDAASTPLISFLRETLAPNTLETLFLQDRKRTRLAHVTIDAIYRGPLKRHRASLKRLMLDSSDKVPRGPTSSSDTTRWRAWMPNRDVLNFITSGRMSSLRELSIALDYKDWHHFLQRLPQMPHLRSLNIPFIADHATPAFDPRELALQVVDVIVLRPEVELCYMGISHKCFEILENRPHDDVHASVDAHTTSAPVTGPGGAAIDEEDEDEDEEGSDEEDDEEEDDDNGTAIGGGGIDPDETESEISDHEDSDTDSWSGSEDEGSKIRLRLREILFYDDKVAIFKARHGRL